MKTLVSATFSELREIVSGPREAKSTKARRLEHYQRAARKMIRALDLVDVHTQIDESDLDEIRDLHQGLRLATSRFGATFDRPTG